MPQLRPSVSGDDAHGCVCLFSRVSGLPQSAAAQGRRLLRVLLLRVRGLPTGTGQLVVLHEAQRSIVGLAVLAPAARRGLSRSLVLAVLPRRLRADTFAEGGHFCPVAASSGTAERPSMCLRAVQKPQ